MIVWHGIILAQFRKNAIRLYNDYNNSLNNQFTVHVFTFENNSLARYYIYINSLIPAVTGLVNISRLHPIKLLPFIPIIHNKRINNIPLYQETNI